MHIHLAEFFNAAEYSSFSVGLPANVAVDLLPGSLSMEVLLAKLLAKVQFRDQGATILAAIMCRNSKFKILQF